MILSSRNIATTAIMPVMSHNIEVQKLDSMSVCGSACVYIK